MRSLFPFIVVVIASFGLTGTLGAEPWTDQAELSFVDTGGNTETTTLAAKNTLKGPLSEKLTLTWSLSSLVAETDGVTTAEQYFTEVRTDYSFSEHFYGFGIGSWKSDEPAGLKERTSLGVGAGYRFLTGPVHTLSGEAGLNRVAEKFTDGTDNDYSSGRAFGSYGWKISDTAGFSQTVEYLSDLEDSDNYQINTTTGFVSTVNQLLSLKTSYDTQYDNQPPAGFEKTDTRLSVTMVFNLM